MLRLATVGTSAITEKFLSACKLTNRYVFKTAYSRDENKGEEFAYKHGFENYSTDIYALANDPEIDAVYIATPNVFHYEQSKLFLKNNKNVICEKPIVTKLSEYEELISLANQKGLIYMEAIMSRHCSHRSRLHNALKEIGNITQARIDFCQFSSRYEAFKSGEKVNIFDMSLAAGTLMDLGIYCVYAAVDLFGKPNEINATASFLKGGADGAGTAIFTYNDFIVTLTYSKAGQSAIGSEIIGDKGAIKIGSISQYANISLLKNGIEKNILGIPERAEVMSGEAYKFADYIENFGEFENDYKQTSELTHTVLSCMDLIKQKANIKYRLKEYSL